MYDPLFSRVVPVRDLTFIVVKAAANCSCLPIATVCVLPRARDIFRYFVFIQRRSVPYVGSNVHIAVLTAVKAALLSTAHKSHQQIEMNNRKRALQ